MKLLDNQFNESSLSRLGEEACRLLIVKDFAGLAEKFGYALALNYAPAVKIEMDFQSCLSGCSVAHPGSCSNIESVTVKHFKPNDTGLISLIECVVLVENKARVLVELIVTKNGKDLYLYLEQVSAAD